MPGRPSGRCSYCHGRIRVDSEESLEPLAQRGFSRPPVSPEQNIIAISKNEFRAKLKNMLDLVQLMPERGSSPERS
jgi:hypothetical protein